MTLREFIKKYDGKYVDYDGAYGAQCMDSMHFYIDEVLLGKKSPEVLRAPSAKLAYLTFTQVDLFEKIENTPKGVPQEGDIIFWGGGTYGHVAIFIEGNVNDFFSFDQNYPTGSKCHKQYHNYDSVLGWLRYKGDTMSLKDTIIDFDDDDGKRHNVGWYVYEWHNEKSKRKQETEELAKQIAEKNKDYERLQKTNEELTVNLSELRGDIQTLKQEKVSLESIVESQKGQLDGLGEQIMSIQGTVKNYIDMVENLQAELDEEKSKSKSKLKNYSRWELFLALFRR